MVTRLRLTRGEEPGTAERAQSEPIGRSSTDRAELKTTCPKATLSSLWIFEAFLLLHFLLKVRPSPSFTGRDRKRRGSPRIVVAHKRDCLSTTTFRSGDSRFMQIRSLPNLSTAAHKPQGTAGSPFISRFLTNRGFLVVLLAQTSLRRVFNRRDSSSSPPRCASNEIRPSS